MSPTTSMQLLVFILIPLSSCYGKRNTSFINVSPNGTRLPVKLNLEDAIDYGVEQMTMLSHLEDSLENAKISVRFGSPSYGQLIDSLPSMRTHTESRYAEIVVKATSYIADRYYLSQGGGTLMTFTKALKNIKLIPTRMGSMCYSTNFKESICRVRNLKYRSLDGSCNNLKNPYWGKSITPYRRNMYPAYKDGISDMNDMLPNPRELSYSLVTDSDENDNYNTFDFSDKTMAVGIWALFIGQDMSHTVVSSSGVTKKAIECCHENGSPLPPRHKHPLCAPITIPKLDPFFHPLGRTCMNYVRSALALPHDCTFGYRDQVNQATHYLDASMIYGTSLNEMKSLRKNSKGLMLTVSPSPSITTMLPLSNNSTSCQSVKECFRAGDSRVNSHPHLLALYTLWVQEHNRIAGELALINTHWNDEVLFQETRKIIIAMIQQITFNEWLPALIGASNTKKALAPYFNVTKSRNNYQSSIDASTSDAFASIIVPMAYSMLSGSFGLSSDYLQNATNFESMESFFKDPYEMIMLHFDELLRGLVSQKLEPVDMSFSKNFTEHLYEENGFGMDILSLSIQRSRDHGIPSFTQFRQPCGLRAILNEKDLADFMNETIARKLMSIYKNVDDIDLIVGALFETHLNGAIISPTMSCIINDQLVKSRMGDMYFYDLPSIFTPNQLSEIRSITLSKLLCANGKTIKQVPLNAFRRNDPVSNKELVGCEPELIPKINLEYWAEE